MHHFLKRKNSLIFLWKAQKVSDFFPKVEYKYRKTSQLVVFGSERLGVALTLLFR